TRGCWRSSGFSDSQGIGRRRGSLLHFRGKPELRGIAEPIELFFCFTGYRHGLTRESGLLLLIQATAKPRWPRSVSQKESARALGTMSPRSGHSFPVFIASRTLVRLDGTASYR